MFNYIIISNQIGSGNIGKVYLIKRIEPPHTLLVAKIFEERGNEQYKNEKEILSLFSNLNEPFSDYIIKLRDIEIALNFDNVFSFNSRYLLFDYLEYGNLSQYLLYMKEYTKFSETYVKLICYKLLKALDIIHKKNICHNKLDINNIMFDNEFNPIIIHFSEAYITNNSFRKDFQGLAKILAILMTSGGCVDCECIINPKNKKVILVFIDSFRRKIIDRDFWKKYEKEIPKEFITFFNTLMIKKVNIDDLLKNEWLKEIKYRDEHYIEIENKLKEYCKIRYKNLLNKKENENINVDINSMIDTTNNYINLKSSNSLIENTLNSDRCSENLDEENNIFNLEIKNTTKEPKGILFNYIKITINNKENKNFIYGLIMELLKELKNLNDGNDANIRIDYDNKYLSFNLTIEDNNEINGDQIENFEDYENCGEDCNNSDYDFDDNEDYKEDLIINLQMVKYKQEDKFDYNFEQYYLMINYIQGEIYDYYYYFDIIKEKVNSKLNRNKVS